MKSKDEGTMFHINKRPAIRPSKLWSDGAERLEAAVTDWYRLIEPELPPGVNCNLSLWSNEHYLLAAVASFAVAGNSDAELVLDVGIHRNHSADQVATFRVEICRECGSPLAAMTAPPLSLDSFATISARDMTVLIGGLDSFLRDQAPCVLRQLIGMQPVTLPTASASRSLDASVTQKCLGNAEVTGR